MILDFNALRGFEYGFVAWLTKTLRFCKCHVVRNIYRGILRNSETKIDSKLKKDSSRLAYNDACLACNDILESTQNQDFQSKDSLGIRPRNDERISQSITLFQNDVKRQNDTMHVMLRAKPETSFERKTFCEREIFLDSKIRPYFKTQNLDFQSKDSSAEPQNDAIQFLESRQDSKINLYFETQNLDSKTNIESKKTQNLDSSYLFKIMNLSHVEHSEISAWNLDFNKDSLATLQNDTGNLYSTISKTQNIFHNNIQSLDSKLQIPQKQNKDKHA